MKPTADSDQSYRDSQLELVQRQNQSDTNDDNGIILHSCLICILMFLTLSPVVYSWYLVWAIPLAVLILSQTSTESKIIRALSTTTLTWGALSSCTYLPRLSYLYDNIWYFSDLWILIEYGTLALTFVLATRYTLTSS